MLTHLQERVVAYLGSKIGSSTFWQPNHKQSLREKEGNQNWIDQLRNGGRVGNAAARLAAVAEEEYGEDWAA